jgi:hypothetical protein
MTLYYETLRFAHLKMAASQLCERLLHGLDREKYLLPFKKKQA